MARVVVRLAAIVAVLIVPPLAVAVDAQERPAPVAKLAVGALWFADDGIPKEDFRGGAVRAYLTPRLSVGPEISFVSGHNHSHLILTGNVTFDVIGPRSGRPRAVTPFVTAGAGLYRTTESFPFERTFTSSEGTFTAGGGVRIRVARRVLVGAEARIGWELHVRLNGLVGVQLGD